MTPTAIPVLPRGVRMQFDRVRRTDVLLGPERALMLDQIGAAILKEVDGLRSVEVIAGDLARRFGAPEDQVRADVADFLGDLADKRLVDLTDG
ncbi:Coenzyme PQQ synthesis protein D [Defluviimonas aquaemixtae]|uniref:Coenzyme PQQ synthesis protein D n=1 Tax=Albidovulum aquaemixtae TaxID=1542388 RepID=A0A2R8B3Q2_9RHOB|nr:pyrroloquinoline quinone biosynthesis peptide chaperone PqqD [Defluviimonas aquaemixtae]SPH17246.1 Coenzyme PQQ synthesis protein D [Defluviimonas aquaemixtae]